MCSSARASALFSLHSYQGVKPSTLLLNKGAAGEHEPSLVVAEGGHFRHDHYWRGAGIALPIFSLRTRMSVGTGEFRDMRILIDFCEAVQFQLIQVLPVNDTSVHKMWWDSYPYSSLSVSIF